jgi:hypothetical protein
MGADLALAQVFEIQLDLGNSPRGFEAEDRLIKVFVSRASNNTTRFPAPSRAQGVPPSPPVPFGAPLFPPSLEYFSTAPEPEGQSRRSRQA